MAKKDQKKDRTRLIVVDISSFIFRAFYAVRILNAPDGTPVNALHGVLSMLLKLMSKYRPTHMVMARDLPGPSFRHEKYDLYKANRSAPPEELIPQFDLIKILQDKMNVANIAVEKYEADDVIGSIAVQWQDDFDEVFIASGDKDLMQFINDKVKMLDTMKDKLYGPDEVFEKMGVRPDQIVDYLSMLGDASDNIPGMKGIGAKGAAKLLAEYGTLEECIANKDQMKGKKLTNAFENHLDDAILSKDLVQIVTDLDLGHVSEDTKFKFYPSNDLLDFLTGMGFKSAVTKLKDLAMMDDLGDQGNTEEFERSVNTGATVEVQMGQPTNLGLIFNKIELSKKVGVFPVWSNGDRFNKSLFGLAVATEDTDTFYFPIVEQETQDLLGKGIKVLEPKQFEKLWQILFYNSKVTPVVEDLKEAYVFSDLFKALPPKVGLDLAQVHYLINPSGKHDIGSLAKDDLGKELTPFNQAKADPSNMPTENLAQIACERALALVELSDIYLEKLNKEDLLKIYETYDSPLIPILAKMENYGVHLNTNYFEELSGKFSKEIDKIEKKVEKEVGEIINLKSPKQVSKLLFEDLGLPIIKKTKTGASTDSSVLTELDAYYDSPVPGMILRHRELSKLLSTYVDTFPKLVSKKTKKIHTNFNQKNAATGRLSSDNPNLQNIPVRTESGKLLRKGFIAKPGNVLLSADYSQVELRILAHFSEDTTMVEAFNNDQDIHAQTASEVFTDGTEKVTSELRSRAKAINFGLMYGQSSFGLSQTLGIPRNEAKDYITQYFIKFSKVKSYLDTLREKAEDTGFAETMFGRKRFLPNISSTNRNIKAMAERVAINSPIQGTAADIIKVAMISIDKELTERKLKSKMILQVHDELIFDVVEDELKDMKELVKRNMESAVELKVPLKVDMGIGVNWFDLK